MTFDPNCPFNDLPDLPPDSETETKAILRYVYPYCRIGDVVRADIAKRQTAAVYLKALAAAGILKETKAGRENLYINPPLLALLAESE